MSAGRSRLDSCLRRNDNDPLLHTSFPSTVFAAPSVSAIYPIRVPSSPGSSHS